MSESPYQIYIDMGFEGTRFQIGRLVLLDEGVDCYVHPSFANDPEKSRFLNDALLGFMSQLQKRAEGTDGTNDE